MIFEGKLEGKGLKFAIVVSRFNEFITSKLLGGAENCLKRHGVADKDIDVVWVPGALEIPLLAKKLAKSDKYNAIITFAEIFQNRIEVVLIRLTAIRYLISANTIAEKTKVFF